MLHIACIEHYFLYVAILVEEDGVRVDLCMQDALFQSKWSVGVGDTMVLRSIRPPSLVRIVPDCKQWSLVLYNIYCTC